MQCSVRTHYELTFYHDELVSVGFDASDLLRLYRITNATQVKFQVYWDKEGEPHFHFQTGQNILCPNTSPGNFYHCFVTWCYHKTGIRGYRVIHSDNRVNLLFGHLQDNVNPLHVFPEYDFTGFSPKPNKYQDCSKPLNWKCDIKVRCERPRPPICPALVRPYF
jgi:hypothetical protein